MQSHHKKPVPTTVPRSGAYIVEFSLVIPVFAVFMVAIMEFGHAYLVIATINAAAKDGARYGAVEGVTTAQVTARVQNLIGSAIPLTNVTVMIKDASVFDVDPLDASTIDYAALPNLDLTLATERQMFLVRVEVPYNDVALLPPFFAKDLNLTALSVTRHE